MGAGKLLRRHKLIQWGLKTFGGGIKSIHCETRSVLHLEILFFRKCVNLENCPVSRRKFRKEIRDRFRSQSKSGIRIRYLAKKGSWCGGLMKMTMKSGYLVWSFGEDGGLVRMAIKKGISGMEVL